MTLTAQLQPYFGAAQQLLQLADARQAAIAEDQFMGAVRSFREAVDPQVIPEMPESRISQLDDEIRRLSAFSAQDKLYGQVAQSFVQRLRGLNFLPPSSRRESAQKRHQRLIGLGTGLHDPGDTMMLGSAATFDPKRTKRGLGVGLPDALYIGGMASETRDSTTFRKPIMGAPIIDVVEEPALKEPEAVINPFSGELMVAGRLWVRGVAMENGHYADKVIRSRYRLERKIGEGGTSNVYIAREDESDRELAIKVVNNARTKQEQEAIYEGFLNEQRLSGTVERERSMRVYGAGRTSNGFPFIVMEYLSGGSLYNAKFDLKETISLCAQVVAAVAEAHRDGIVHLDIKPENFFLSRDRKKVKLADYGLATLAELIEESQTKEIYGTFGYVPLENIPYSRRPSPIGTKQRDVWALGVTLYELLTGVFPFEGANPTIMMTKMIAPVTPPSEIRKEIPSMLDHVVMKALATDPTNRYKDAEEMLFDLVSYKARASEAEAGKVLQDIGRIEEEIRRSDEAQAYLLKRRTLILRESWRRHLEDALRDYGRLYDEYHSETMKDKMVDLNLDLFRWADFSGDDEAVRHRAARITNLAPANTPAAEEVTRPIHVELYLDGRRPRGADPKFSLIEMRSHAGRIEMERLLTADEVKKSVSERHGAKAFDLSRGSVYGVRFTAAGAIPLFIPFPVRPGSHEIRIPLYAEHEVPKGFVVIPAGPVAARQGPGSYSEKFDIWRAVEHDYAMGPLVTNQSYQDYLEQVAIQLGLQEAAARTPKNWRPVREGGFIYEDGRPILPNGPVTHIRYQNAGDYLAYQSQILGMTVRLPTLDEWKRAMRGNDARLWSWGDAVPDVGLAAFRYPAPGGSGALVASAIDDPNVLDLSPFSVPDDDSRTLRHVAGNVQKFLDFGTPEERSRIAQALNMSVEDLTSKYFLAAGASYDGPAPSNPDILQRKEYNEIIPAGIFPVIELRPAASTPSRRSLTPSEIPHPL